MYLCAVLCLRRGGLRDLDRDLVLRGDLDRFREGGLLRPRSLSRLRSRSRSLEQINLKKKCSKSVREVGNDTKYDGKLFFPFFFIFNTDSLNFFSPLFPWGRGRGAGSKEGKCPLVAEVVW